MLKALKTALQKTAFHLNWTCTYCGREVFDDGFFCEECGKKLPFNDGDICAHCGRRAPSPREYCETCAGRLTAFDIGRSVFTYEGIAADLIKKFKYENARYLAEVFAPLLVAVYRRALPAADAVVFVPMYKKDLRRRGYNQTELLAQAFSRLTGVEKLTAAEKRRSMKKQVDLGRKTRLENTENAFRIVDKKAVAGKNILILDDVTTTGATANSLARELKKSGAAKVYLLTLASVSSEKKSENQRESGLLSEKE